MLGSPAAEAAALSHAEADVLCPVTRAARQPTNVRICMPNSGRYVFVYLCAGLDANGRCDRQFILAASIGALPTMSGVASVLAVPVPSALIIHFCKVL